MKSFLRLLSTLVVISLPVATALAQPFSNRAIVFNGSTTRIHTNSAWNNGWIGFNPAYITVEAWINPTRVAGGNVIAEDGLSSNNSVGWFLYIQDGKLVFRASDDVCCAQNLVSNASILLNTWTHVAATYSVDDSMRIYINGALENTIKAFFTHIGTLGANNQILSVGVNNDDNVSSYSYFQGQMDEIRIWSVSRSGAAIAANYQKWLTGNELGLYLYYHCNEASGDTIYNYGLAGSAFNLWVPYPGTLGHSAPFALPGSPSVPVDTALSAWNGDIGTSIRLNGGNFSATLGANIVRFGGVKTVTPTGGGPTYLDVPVPPGAGFGPVQVTTNGMTAYSPRQFTPTFNGIDAISGGSFESNGGGSTIAQPQRLVVADLDDDGKSDVVVSSSSAHAFYRNVSTARNLQLDNPTGYNTNYPSNAVIADFDGDGKLDVASGRSGEVWIDVLRNTSTPGSISFSATQPNAGTAYATSVAVADFDGDGKPDLVTSVSPWYTLRILRNLSTVGSIAFSEAIQPSGVYGNTVSAGDVDGDQKPDILYTNNGAGSLIILHNGGTLGGIRFDSVWTIPLPSGSQPTSSFVADFNADGKPDVAVFCPGTDEVVLLRNNGSASPVNFVRTSLPYQGLGSATDLAFGDADGDGLPDVVISSNQGPVVAYRNASTAGGIAFESGVDLETGNAQVGLALADLNNDGKPDLLSLNQQNSSLALLRNTPLGTPGDFSATDNQTTGVTLTWTDRANGETGYVIYRDGVQVQTTGANAEIWEDTSPSLLQGKPYAYWVAATNDAKGLRSDTVYDFGRKQFRGEVSGKVTTQGGVGGGAGISGVDVSLARSSPNRYKALSFDGVDDYVLVPWDPNFDLVSGTIEFWVRPEWAAPPAFSPVILTSGDYPPRYAIRMSNNLDALIVAGSLFGTFTEIPVPYSFQSGDWYHIALTMNGSSYVVMVNGTVVGTPPLAPYARFGAPLVFGGYTSIARFEGSIDEVRIWNSVRSVESIQSTMNAYIPAGTSGLVGYWRFDEGAGSVTADNGQSGSHYASLVNGVAWTDEPGPARRAGTTDAQGNYSISQVDYGDATTTYSLTAARGTDVITPDTISVQFTQNSYVFADQNFIDTSTFALAGKISVKGYPGVGLKGVSLLVDGYPIDSTGPGGLFSIGLTADPHVVKPVWHGHHFSPESLIVQIQNDTAGLVFEDITRDTLRGLVAAGLCEYPMGVATVRLIETTSGSASYDTSITTGPSGQFSVRVPSLSYKVIVDDLASHDADALAWFASAQLDVSIIEQDPAALADTLLYPPGVDWKYAKLLYRSRPILTIQGIPTAGDCPSIIVRQGKRIPVRVKVTEQYGNYPPCVVDSGKVDIADDVGDREVPVAAPLVNGLATYNLIAGQPNVVAGGDHPYGKLFQVQTTQPGGSASADFWMVVLGTRSRGRTSTTVTPQLPFLVLRDPPGDQSFSYMKKDSTYCFDWGFSERQELALGGWVSGRAGLMTDVPLITDAGFYVDITVSAGYEGVRDTSSHFTSCVRASEVIQTSDDELLAGPPGDIYVTVSLVLSYGVSDILSFDPQTCQPSLTRRLTFDRVTFNNLIAYTDTYIRRSEIPRLDDLIAYWQQLGNPDSAGLFQRTKDQWQRILENAVEERAQSIASPFAGRDTVSYSGGVTLSREWESTEERSSHFETSVTVDEHAAISGGIIQSNDIAHLLAGFEQGFRWERFWDTTRTTTVSRAFGYTLYDDDPLDKLHVNLRQSPTGGSPLFVLLDGETACPWEPGTQRRQQARLSLYPPISNGVDPESTVIITAQCANTSESGDTVTYRLDNPYAAGDSVPYMYIGDTPFIGLSAPVRVPPGEFRNLYVSVKKAPQWADYNNVRLVLFTDCDPIHTGDTASFAIHFEDGVDSPPEVLSKNAAVAKGDTAVIELKALDPDGGQVTFQLIDEPRHGRFIDDTPPTLSYLPDAGYVGADKFLVNASDGVNVVPQRFDLSVVNTPPAAGRARIDTTVDEDTPVTFHLVGGDPDGDPLVDSIIYRPAHGTISGTLSNLSYVPDPDYNGTDDFTYGFFDGQALARATVGITLRALADPLTVRHDTCALSGDEPTVTINVLSNDKNQDDRLMVIVDSVVWGSAGFALNNGDGSLTYYDTSVAPAGMPAGSGIGRAAVYNDQLTYHITNGVDTVEEELTVTIDRVNSRPVAGFGSALDFDGSNDGVTTNYLLTNPSEITIEYWFRGDNPHSVVRQQPDASTYIVSGWNGLHILSNDGGIFDGMPTGTINDGQWHHVAMTWKMDAPDGFRSYRDGVLVAARYSSDIPLPLATLNNGPLTIGYAYLYGEYMKGTLDEVRIWNVARSDSEIAAGMYTTYPAGEPGLDATWHFDENSGSTTYSVGNNPFLPASPLSNMTNPWQAAGVLPRAVVSEDDSTEIGLPAYDRDGDPLTYSIIGQPAHGTLTWNGADWAYVPEKDFTGFDYVTYTVDDGKASSALPATLGIEVLNTQDPPVVAVTPFETSKNKEVFMRLVAGDPDPDDVLHYTVGPPAHGALSQRDTFPNEFFYQPAAGFAGKDSFVNMVTDGIDTTRGIITVFVTNTRPVAPDTLVAQSAGTAFSLFLPASDGDGDSLVYSIVTGTANGTLNLDSLPKVVFTPAPGFYGPDSLTFSVSDGADADTGMVTFVILLPTAVDDKTPLVPMAYELYQNYPNPFNPTTTIEYDLAGPSRVTLTVFNILGQVVTTLIEELQPAGKHIVPFNANRYASGVYFYRLVAGNTAAKGDGTKNTFVKVRKMLLLK